MSTAQAIATRDAMHRELQAAKTAADLRALYLDWIGLGALDVEDEADDGTSDDEARGILADFIREHCYGAGIPCPDFSSVGAAS